MQPADLFDAVADRLVGAAPRINLRPEILHEWEQMLPEFRALKEHQREQIRFEDLNLKPDGAVHNILAVYGAADEAERDYWGRWYVDASGVAQQIADRYGLPLTIVAGVLAVLSPGNLWWRNVRVGEKLIKFWSSGALRVIGKIESFSTNVKKALTILETQTVPKSLVGTPKVKNFYRSLVDPVGTENDIVVDSHALNIWSGRKVSIKEAIKPSDELLARIEDDYAEAARQLGISPQALQATTWFIWKNVTSGQATQQPKEQEDAHDRAA